MFLLFGAGSSTSILHTSGESEFTWLLPVGLLEHLDVAGSVEEVVTPAVLPVVTSGTRLTPFPSPPLSLVPSDVQSVSVAGNKLEGPATTLSPVFVLGLLPVVLLLLVNPIVVFTVPLLPPEQESFETEIQVVSSSGSITMAPLSLSEAGGIFRTSFLNLRVLLPLRGFFPLFSTLVQMQSGLLLSYKTKTSSESA